MAKMVCDFCGQAAAKMIGGLWICAACAGAAQVETRVAPGGFRVYVRTKMAERLAYQRHQEGDWTRAQLEDQDRKGAARLREIAAG